MKLQTNTLLKNLNEQELKVLATEVKETICKNFKKTKKRNLTVAEFWDLQRRKRNLYTTRFAF